MQTNTQTRSRALLPGTLVLAACCALLFGVADPSSTDQVEHLRLRTSISGTQAVSGQVLTALLSLENLSPRGISGCVVSWEEHSLVSSGGPYRRFGDPVDGINEDNRFHLPPGKTLTWTVRISLPTDVTGDVRVVARLRGDPRCNGWQETIDADPVLINVSTTGPKMR